MERHLYNTFTFNSLKSRVPLVMLSTSYQSLALRLCTLLCAALLASVAHGQDYSQLSKLVNSTRNVKSVAARSEGDYFGCAVAISGNYAVVGAFLEDDDTSGAFSKTDAGSAFIFFRSGGVWSLQQKITASDRDSNALFGNSVSIDGDYLVVGATGARTVVNGVRVSTGAAYVFLRNGTTWTQQQKLVATDGAAADSFGKAVCIKGASVLVGAPFEDEDENGANTFINAGSAYLFSRTGTVWSQQQKIVASDRAAVDGFGSSVAMDGSYAVVGAPFESENAVGSSTMAGAGSAYVYMLSGATWAQQQKIVAGDRTNYDAFGGAVSISGDYIAVGAYNGDEDYNLGSNQYGSAYIFARSGTTWPQQRKIIAPVRTAYAKFGVAISFSGNSIAVGSFAAKAYVFTRNGSNWPLEQTVAPSDAATAGRFSAALCISADDLFAGAGTDPNDTAGANKVTGAGSAYAFTRSNVTWTQQQKMVLKDRVGIWFSGMIAISGDYAVAGSVIDAEDATGNPSNTLLYAGSASVFKRIGGTWVFQQKLVASDRKEGNRFGCQVAIKGDYIVVGAFYEGGSLVRAGAAYVFYRSGNTWSQQQKLVAPDRTADYQFGNSVSIDGDYIAVGSPNDRTDENGAYPISNAGSIWIFNRSGTTWSAQQKLVASDRVSHGGRLLGSNVAISGAYVLSGTNSDPYDTLAGNPLTYAGSAYMFSRSGTTWTQQQKIVASDRAAQSAFGTNVSLDGDYAAIGSPNNSLDENGASSTPYGGAVYILVRNGTYWKQQQKLVASDRTTNMGYGTPSLSGSYLATTAAYNTRDAQGNNLGTIVGAVYTYSRTDTVWSFRQKVFATDGAVLRSIQGATLNGASLIVTAPATNTDVSGGDTLDHAGALYTFNRTIPLPLALRQFTARADGPHSRLEWTAGAELPKTRYTIDRSADAVSFQSLGSVAADGSLLYRYDDAAPREGVNYYRLAVDAPVGSERTYSQTVAVYHNIATGGVTLTPVPAGDVVTITCTSPSSLGQSATVYDICGRAIWRAPLQGYQTLDCSRWPAGHYSLRLQDGTTLRIVKH